LSVVALVENSTVLCKINYDEQDSDHPGEAKPMNLFMTQSKIAT